MKKEKTARRNVPRHASTIVRCCAAVVQGYPAPKAHISSIFCGVGHPGSVSAPDPSTLGTAAHLEQSRQQALAPLIVALRGRLLKLRCNFAAAANRGMAND